MPQSHLTAIILAGGRGKRIGIDKTKLIFKDRLLIETIIEKIHPLFSEIIIVLNKKNYSKFPKSLLEKFNKIRIIKDEIDIQTPLVGIYTGLKYSSSVYNFVFACDMPYINNELIKLLIREIDNDYDVIIPKYKKMDVEFIEPLFAIYSKSCIDVIIQNIRDKKYQIRKIFEKLKIRFIEEEKIRKFDEQLLSFVNINEMQDLRFFSNRNFSITEIFH